MELHQCKQKIFEIFSFMMHEEEKMSALKECLARLGSLADNTVLHMRILNIEFALLLNKYAPQ